MPTSVTMKDMPEGAPAKWLHGLDERSRPPKSTYSWACSARAHIRYLGVHNIQSESPFPASPDSWIFKHSCGLPRITLIPYPTASRKLNALCLNLPLPSLFPYLALSHGAVLRLAAKTFCTLLKTSSLGPTTLIYLRGAPAVMFQRPWSIETVGPPRTPSMPHQSGRSSHQIANFTTTTSSVRTWSPTTSWKHGRWFFEMV